VPPPGAGRSDSPISGASNADIVVIGIIHQLARTVQRSRSARRSISVRLPSSGGSPRAPAASAGGEHAAASDGRPWPMSFSKISRSRTGRLWLEAY